LCDEQADIRLIEAGGLFSLEAALTGEPEGIKKVADWVGTKKELTEAEEKKLKEEQEKKLKEAQEAKVALEAKIADLKAKLKGDALEEALSALQETNKGEEKKEKSLDEEKNMVFMGCQIVDGRGKGVVVKTGMATKMGEIQHMLNTADEKESPLEQKLDQLGNRLGIASITISCVVLIVGLTTNRGTHDGDQPRWLQMILIAVSLTVAAVPEGLPACVTITLAIGMAAMAKRNAIIRQLHSVETLGSASVICSDKTGTLTAGKMTAVRVWFGWKLFRISGVGYDPNGVIAPAETNPDDKAAMQRGADLVKQQPGI
jgi:magnesium-transporting ATPase (P-type)